LNYVIELHVIQLLPISAQGHWNWHRSICHLRLPINVP